MSEDVIVLDIEGTVCPISFVQDILFPYALRRCETEISRIQFPLASHRSELECYLDQFPTEFKSCSEQLLGHIKDLMNRDVKIGYLKSLQGYLWQSGYESGEIKAPIYEDAVTAIKSWSKSQRVIIYSSGSIAAQKLLFKYTNFGDLNEYLSGYFDTLNAGPKTESSSYKKIEKTIQGNAYRFFSDNPKEIDAAARCGWSTTFVVRPGNPEYPGYEWPDQMVTEFK